MRIEKDSLGEKLIPSGALFGIHSLRAKENFPSENAFHIEWYKSMGQVKLACYLTYREFKKALQSKYKESEIPFKQITDEIINVLEDAALEVSNGKYFEWFIVPAIQGGAGTSINMNINEIIANASLLKLDKKPGQYEYIDPIEHANVYQSTNDVVPTSIHICVIKLLTELEEKINQLRLGIEELEKQNRNVLRIGYTQMQEAVPSSFGRLFSSYNEALSRDWWRVSKCFERIKVVNLGGSAIGTAITVPRFFLMEVTQTLQRITGLPVTRSENLSDATSNLDTFVEVHAILKAHAVNLEKMSNDIRLLASDLTYKTVSIPQKQVGSSIMPGKINPVIAEYTVGICHKVYANDMLVASLCGQGVLDLNAYIPIIGHAIIESLKLLIAANESLFNNFITGLTINKEISKYKLENSASITTALVPFIGYNKASELATLMKDKCISIFEANRILNCIDSKQLDMLLKPDVLLKEGFTMEDIMKVKNTK